MCTSRCLLLTAVVSLASGQSVAAQGPVHMVKDINQSGISGSAPQPVAAVGRILFFFAADGAKGAELWRTDGTEAGTYLVKDIRPGSAGQFPPFSGVELNGRLLFAADDGVHGKELWISDGTEAGTQTLVDLTPVGGSSISNLTVSGGRAFFTASTPSYGTELWMTDGTAAGTRMLRDVRHGPIGSDPGAWALMYDGVAFAADDGVHGREPWAATGTRSTPGCCRMCTRDPRVRIRARCPG